MDGCHGEVSIAIAAIDTSPQLRGRERSPCIRLTRSPPLRRHVVARSSSLRADSSGRLVQPANRCRRDSAALIDCAARSRPSSADASRKRVARRRPPAAGARPSLEIGAWQAGRQAGWQAGNSIKGASRPSLGAKLSLPHLPSAPPPPACPRRYGLGPWVDFPLQHLPAAV
jgi:hypothetical protein